MTKRTLLTLVLASVLAAAASAAPAFAAQVVSLGVVSENGESLTYGYGELSLSPTLALGLEYRSDKRLGLSLWHGVSQGLYGEIDFSTADGEREELVEFGVWRALPLSGTVSVTGWIGAQGELGGSSVWAKASAEVAISLTEQVSLFVGGATTLLKDDDVTSTYAGVGLYF